MPVAAPGRRADRDEHGFGTLDPFREVGGEAQPAALGIRLDQRLEPRLPDRHAPLVQPVDLARILVDAAHLVPEIGEAGAGNQPHITRADHRDTHSNCPFGQGLQPGGGIIADPS